MSTVPDPAATPQPRRPSETLPPEAALGAPRLEWMVEVTWADPVAAGAKGPTSVYGPVETIEVRDRLLEQYRRDRDITATRILTRYAAYTEWEPAAGLDGQVSPITAEEREARLQALFDSLQPGP